MSHIIDDVKELPVVELKGSFRKMGQIFGESCRLPIRELYEIRLQAALSHAKDRGREYSVDQALAIASENLSILQEYDEDIYLETLGIAEGANLSLAQIFILQGLTDFRDYLSWGEIADGFGCTAFAVSPERSKSKKLLMAQNWDLGTSNMKYVCMVKRSPDVGPETCSLTVYGGLSMVSLNSEGIASGTTNIKTTDTRPGVHYLNILHKVMKATTIEDAENAITSAPRAGAHFYMIGDSKGKYKGIECSALKHAYIPSTNGVMTHCNHILDPSLEHLQAEDMGPSTCQRQKRIDELLQKEHFSIQSIKEILSDHDGGELAICRHDVGEGISTNGSVIIEPENGTIHACRSFPHEGKWQKFSF